MAVRTTFSSRWPSTIHFSRMSEATISTTNAATVGTKRNMTRIKICGITNSEDALAAFEAGADLLGFIGVPESPRYVTSGQVDEFLGALPAFVHSVAVVRGILDAEDYATRY